MRYDRECEAPTKFVWSMTGNMVMPFLGGYFSMFMDLMAGPMFDRGLEKLKVVVEKTKMKTNAVFEKG